MDKITIEITAEELDLIGAGLGKLPYERVFQLIANLSKQYQEKTNKKEGKEEEDLSLNT